MLNDGNVRGCRHSTSSARGQPTASCGCSRPSGSDARNC